MSKEKRLEISKKLRQFFNQANRKFFWHELNCTKQEAKVFRKLNPGMAKFFYWQFAGNKVYIRLRKNEFIYMPKVSKKLGDNAKVLQQVQVLVKPLKLAI